jgi:hypothetical protein
MSDKMEVALNRPHSRDDNVRRRKMHFQFEEERKRFLANQKQIHDEVMRLLEKIGNS